MNRTFYLCDGKVELCPKNECYKSGGECMHTTDKNHAITPREERRFEESGFEHDLWEIIHN